MKATQVGFCQSDQNFLGVIETYNPNAGTFFTPVGKLGVTYHEMHYVSEFSYSEFPYEERFPISHELKQMEELLPTGANLY